VKIDRDALAHLRHALVTPLTHIIGYAEMLLEEAGRPELEPQLLGIVGDAEELLGLINKSFARAAAEGAVDPASLKATVGLASLKATVGLASLNATLGPALARVQAACEVLERQVAREDAIRPDVDRIARATAGLVDLVKGSLAQS